MKSQDTIGAADTKHCFNANPTKPSVCANLS